ncbi:hypothetical protein [Acinetobacter seifertii]|uniref:hypothetical protein n=1 Tax=Acinetobacter seifertii TaxID=1530123 RepID=UPI00321A04F3
MSLERNAYNKRMLQLQLIQQTEPAKQTALEQNILKLHQKHDIDAYFAMHVHWMRSSKRNATRPQRKPESENRKSPESRTTKGRNKTRNNRKNEKTRSNTLSVHLSRYFEQ